MMLITTAWWMHKYITVLDYLHLACFILQCKKEFYMKHKVVWFHICVMAFDPLQPCMCFFTDLWVYGGKWCITIQGVATWTSHMSSPMEPVLEVDTEVLASFQGIRLLWPLLISKLERFNSQLLLVNINYGHTFPFTIPLQKYWRGNWCRYNHKPFVWNYCCVYECRVSRCHIMITARCTLT